ncbi:MAG: prepilin-type N-terminal cleavage/methylation domain-containing protein [Bdellovibrionota bacterium]
MKMFFELTYFFSNFAFEQYENNQKPKRGFTMIELLMVIMLVAILGAVALPQFLDFRNEGKAAAAQSLQQSLNVGVKLQKTQTILRCGAPTDATIPLDTFSNNDITSGATPPCTTAQVPESSERRFVDSANFPRNPFNDLTTVGSCDSDTYVGWCYDVATGIVVASAATSHVNTCSSCNQSCNASGGGGCSDSCTGSGCIQSCNVSGGGGCMFDCPDGYCTQSCNVSGGGGCVLTCDGGNCTQSANVSGGGGQTVECSGGGCS